MLFEVPHDNVQLEPDENEKATVTVKPGDIVSFSYDQYSRRSEPVNPVVFRIRSDMDWNQVLHSHVYDLPLVQTLNGIESFVPCYNFISLCW